MPGGANTEIHSGTSTGMADLWDNRVNLDLADRCLRFIAEEIRRCPEFDSVFGLQICNEAVLDAPGMYEWYSSVIDDLATINPGLHVYISDGKDLWKALTYAKDRNRLDDRQFCPVIVDTHRYFNHSLPQASPGTAVTAQKVTATLQEISSKASTQVTDGKGAVAVYIGEYSCALPVQSSKLGSNEDTSNLAIQLGQLQSTCWQSKTSGSAFFT